MSFVKEYRGFHFKYIDGIEYKEEDCNRGWSEVVRAIEGWCH